MKKIIIILFSCFIFFMVKADQININAKSAILIDQNTGKVLFKQNENEKLPIASMTKIMSMLLIMEQIDKGNISYDDDVVISKTSSDMGGSQVYLQEGDIYKVKELLKSIAMASANDAVVAMAEKTYGTVENFVSAMNKKAKELGLKNTNFVNVHGLDEDNHYSSAYDMAMIAKELVKYEDILNYTKVYEDYLTKNDGSSLWLVNTNKLVRFYDGVDGLKTGYTEKAGYCLTSTAKKNNLRLISVVIGEESIDNRTQDTVKLLNYGFSTYKVNVIKEKNKKIGTVNVVKGKKNKVDLVLKDDATELLSINDNKSKYYYKFNIDKIVAPIKKSDVVGKVKIYNESNKFINEVEITVKEDVLKANLWDYFVKNIKFSFLVYK